MTMLAEFGTMSLKQVLEPSMEMADGYPMEISQTEKIERDKEYIKEWPYSKPVFLPHLGEEHEAPHPGEIFRQPQLLETLTEAGCSGRTGPVGRESPERKRSMRLMTASIGGISPKNSPGDARSRAGRSLPRIWPIGSAIWKNL